MGHCEAYNTVSVTVVNSWLCSRYHLANPMSDDVYNVVSLFSGAMGLDIGLERTGRFRVLACVEKEPEFCETIRTNIRAGRLRPGLKVIQADIRELDPTDVLSALGLAPGEVDLVTGGPP